MDLDGFKKKYERLKVEENDNKVPSKPMLSVCIQTYQHVDYIKECLDSILMQKTNFEFEILLGEDNSSDGTRDICIDYANRFPYKIRLFQHYRENNIVIEGSPTGRFNFMYNIYSARGKYIAFCEGDDYWVNQNKLQEQIDFLQINKTYSACFTNAIIKNQITNKIYSYKIYKKNNFGVRDIIKGSGALFPTASLVFINVFDEFPDYFTKIKSGDRGIALLLSLKGNFHLIDKPYCVYRKHETGMFSAILKNDKERLIVDFNNIKLLNYFDKYTKFKYSEEIRNAISKRALISLIRNRSTVLNSNKRVLFKYLNFKDWLRLSKNLILNN